MYKCIKVQEIESALCCLPSIPGQCNELLIREREKRKKLTGFWPLRKLSTAVKLYKKVIIRSKEKQHPAFYAHTGDATVLFNAFKHPTGLKAEPARGRTVNTNATY